MKNNIDIVKERRKNCWRNKWQNLFSPVCFLSWKTLCSTNRQKHVNPAFFLATFCFTLHAFIVFLGLSQDMRLLEDRFSTAVTIW